MNKRERKGKGNVCTGERGCSSPLNDSFAGWRKGETHNVESFRESNEETHNVESFREANEVAFGSHLGMMVGSEMAWEIGRRMLYKTGKAMGS
jgi:hypothetical protein